MHDPRVSIIVPAYNSAAFLSRCLDSLRIQTEESLQILVIDDGSQDATRDIAMTHADEDPRVVVMSQANSGLSAARNTGLRNALGEYVCFVDADDWVEPHMVESMLKAVTLVGAQVGITGITVDYVDSKDSLLRSEPRKLPSQIIDKHGTTIRLPIDDNTLNLFGYAWNKIYLRYFLISGELLFEDGLRLVEDIEFNARVLKAADRIVLVPTTAIHYVQRPRESLGTTFDLDYFDLRYLAAQSMDELLAAWGVDCTLRTNIRAASCAMALWNGLAIASRHGGSADHLTQMLDRPRTPLVIGYARQATGISLRARWARTTLARGQTRLALCPAILMRWVGSVRGFWTARGSR